MALRHCSAVKGQNIPREINLLLQSQNERVKPKSAGGAGHNDVTVDMTIAQHLRKYAYSLLLLKIDDNINTTLCRNYGAKASGQLA